MENGLRAMMDNPAAFRQRLRIDADGHAVAFRCDSWQEADFLALDDAWRFSVGRWSGEPPPIRRLWSERPRGHAKTSDLAIMASWALLFSGRPVVGVAAAGDRDQSALLRAAIGTLCRVNPWLGSILDVQQWK